ncbi:histidine phosphatase family protein [Psychrobacter sp.]|uniref:histidine phosphatase family protein n=1 Tax=Psychrobacter sp. TaxID=56811 RepID=UPI0025F6957F|nr:histidine phosphatase family protein [Psychrobacter sp.]
MQLYIWRHPRPKQSHGLCYGQSDIEVDRRKLKRLAHQILRFVRSNQLPRQIWVSPLQRSKQVGQYLVAQGFECYIDDRLVETDFGVWEGKPWSDIDKKEIDNWCEKFADFAPVEGESLSQLFARVEAWIDLQKQMQAESDSEDKIVLVVGHAGWINTAKLISNGKPVPTKPIHWPRAVEYNELTFLEF